jgi:hypothetical protein
MTATTARARGGLAGTLVGLAALTGCATTVPGTALPEAAALEEALSVPPDGFTAVTAGDPPSELCESSGSDDEVPRLDPALGDPGAVAYEAAGTRIEAFAWTVASAGEAERIVGEAADTAAGCDYELFTDFDTDGDGDLDAGAYEEQQARDWSGSGWTGVAIHRTVEASDSEDRETRFVHAGAVVVLVTVTTPGDVGAGGTADDYLAAVADQLD